MANLTEAYDLTLFEDRFGNAVPKEVPQKREEEKRAPKKNIVELPQKELEKNRRAKIHPFKALAMGVCFTIIFSTVISLVYNQVQLTELTDRINTQTRALEEEQALTVQLEMRATEKIKSSDVEQYAREELGMLKITEGQVVYMNMASEDKGTVLQKTERSFLDNILDQIKSWFA